MAGAHSPAASKAAVLMLGSLTHSLNVTWEVVTNANLKPLPDLLAVPLWGQDGAIWVLTSPLNVDTLCFRAAGPGLEDPHWPWGSWGLY